MTQTTEESSLSPVEVKWFCFSEEIRLYFHTHSIIEIALDESLITADENEDPDCNEYVRY